MQQRAKRPPVILALDNVVVPRGEFQVQIDTLRLRAGELGCLIGPNGCGKTTLLLAILGLLPHQGHCLLGGRPYDGRDPRLKAELGFIPDDPGLLFEELTAREHWSLTASVIGGLRPNQGRAHFLQRAESLAAMIGFDPPPQLVSGYSHGMRKKTQIVNALLREPSVIVVDELRNGLDPVTNSRVEAVIQQERQRGAVVIAATHDLAWTERYATEVYILNCGRVLAAGSCRQLRQPRETSLEAAFQRIIGSKVTV